MDKLFVGMYNYAYVQNDNLTQNVCHYMALSRIVYIVVDDNLCRRRQFVVRGFEQDRIHCRRHHRKNQIRNPWITQGIFRSIQTRNKLFKSYVRSPTEQNNCHYKRYRNILTKLIRTSKKLHYSKVLNNAEGNLNSTWKLINELINKNKSQTRTDSLNVNGKDITNPEDVSNEFNSYLLQSVLT